MLGNFLDISGGLQAEVSDYTFYSGAGTAPAAQRQAFTLRRMAMLLRNNAFSSQTSAVWQVGTATRTTNARLIAAPIGNLMPEATGPALASGTATGFASDHYGALVPATLHHGSVHRGATS